MGGDLGQVRVVVDANRVEQESLDAGAVVTRRWQGGKGRSVHPYTVSREGRGDRVGNGSYDRVMFERFTDRARRVVVLAQEESRLLNHNFIGTEHLLLGLIHDGEGVAAKALQSMSISTEAIRAQVIEVVGEGAGSAPSGHIPFTPRAKKVLELSLREALQLGHNYIGTEHILLALVREGDGVAAQVLATMGASLGSVRDQVIRLLSGYTGPERPGADVWSPLIGEERWLTAQRTLSEPSRRVLERALGEALAVSAADIEPSHLLLALLGDDDSRLVRALRDLGVEPEDLRRRLLDERE